MVTMKHIFISYSPKDSKAMQTLRDLLLRAGFTPWIDPAPRPNQDWRDEIDEAIGAASVVLVLLTPNSATSVYVTYEWSLALGLGVMVIPLLYRPAEFHPRLSTLPGFDMGAWKDERHFWDHVIRELSRMFITAQAAGIAPAVPPAAPPATVPPIAPVIPAQVDYNRSVMPTQPGHWIVIRRGPNLNSMYRLAKPIVTLGRDAANDVPINDPEVSRYHLRFTQQGTNYGVEDLGSTNGTMINGKRIIGIAPLQPGTALNLGDTILLSYEVV
jgi:hypothetical protein